MMEIGNGNRSDIERRCKNGMQVCNFRQTYLLLHTTGIDIEIYKYIFQPTNKFKEKVSKILKVWWFEGTPVDFRFIFVYS